MIWCHDQIPHIHPTIALSDLVKDIKLGCSAYIKSNIIFTDFTGWQKGYSAFTYTIKEKDPLIEYVKNQQRHHKKITFKEELMALLQEHQVAFDEKYLL